MRTLVCFVLPFILMAYISTSKAQEATDWAASLSFVRFSPEMDNWRQGYDSDMQGVQATLAYQLFSMIDLGMALGYYSASGQGLLPLNNSTGGEVDYRLMPVELYVTLHGRFSASQWLVPYAGAGYSQVYYRLDISGQSGREGKAQGSHYHAGINFLLNQYDKTAAQRLRHTWGIGTTSIYLETKGLDAEKSGIELGGKMLLLGLKFTF